MIPNCELAVLLTRSIGSFLTVKELCDASRRKSSSRQLEVPNPSMSLYARVEVERPESDIPTTAPPPRWALSLNVYNSWHTTLGRDFSCLLCLSILCTWEASLRLVSYRRHQEEDMKCILSRNPQDRPSRPSILLRDLQMYFIQTGL